MCPLFPSQQQVSQLIWTFKVITFTIEHKEGVDWKKKKKKQLQRTLECIAHCSLEEKRVGKQDAGSVFSASKGSSSRLCGRDVPCLTLPPILLMQLLHRPSPKRIKQYTPFFNFLFTILKTGYMHYVYIYL